MNYKTLSKYFNIDIDKINIFLNYLLKINKVMNLTAIKNKEEMIEKHIYDSLLISKVYDFNNKNVLDVGSGGGFPGIPLAILYPNSSFTLLDSTNKKINYLNDVINLLNLKNVKTICSRVEEIKDKEKYDAIISRAFAPLNIYLELVAYLCKVNGSIIALKGSKGEEELIVANNAINKLNLKLMDTQIEELIESKEKRINYIFKKIDKTNNKYPRIYKDIKKKPL